MARERPRYRDREHAGTVLAARLDDLAGRTNVVVLALPRGGLPVAAPVAARLAAPLGVVVVRKLGVPGRPELAMGALASLGGRVQLIRNDAVISWAGVSEEAFDEVARQERASLERRVADLGSAAQPVRGRVVVVVDDGLATGSTMLAAVRALRLDDPEAILVAVPVAAAQAVALVGAEADQVVCPLVPERFLAVGSSYADFSQVDERDVRRWLTGREPG